MVGNLAFRIKKIDENVPVNKSLEKARTALEMAEKQAVSAKKAPKGKVKAAPASKGRKNTGSDAHI